MNKTITGQEVLKILKVNKPDLALLVFNNELSAYYPADLTSVNESIKKYIKRVMYDRKRMGIYLIANVGGGLEKELENEALEFQKEILPSIIEQIPELLFKITEVEEYERNHGLIAKKQEPAKPDALTPTSQTPIKRLTTKQQTAQVTKKKVRAVAEKLWKKDPSTTKVDMAMRDEINSISGTDAVSEETLQDWIADLNPNRTPGRRPNKP